MGRHATQQRGDISLHHSPPTPKTETPPSSPHLHLLWQRGVRLPALLREVVLHRVERLEHQLPPLRQAGPRAGVAAVNGHDELLDAGGVVGAKRGAAQANEQEEESHVQLCEALCLRV